LSHPYSQMLLHLSKNGAKPVSLCSLQLSFNTLRGKCLNPF